jgi:hypothetical protein
MAGPEGHLLPDRKLSREPRAPRPTNYPETSETSGKARSRGRRCPCSVPGDQRRPAPEGVPALIAACQVAGWRVVVFSTPTGIRFVDPAELEQLTGEPVRSEYRMPGTGTPVPPARQGLGFFLSDLLQVCLVVRLGCWFSGGRCSGV